MIFRNIESGEIKEGKYFKNDEIQIINPTNEILNKIHWEILDDYPVIEELDDYPIIEDEENNEEIEVSDEIIEDTEENNKA